MRHKRQFPARHFSVVAAFAFQVILLATWADSSKVVAQPRPTTPVEITPDLSLAPLVLENISLGRIAKPLSSPTGTSRPTPEFSLPKRQRRTLLLRTRGGTLRVNFSVSLPADVPPGTFSFDPSAVNTPNAIGRLEYSGCDSCPSSFDIGITASSGRTSETRAVRIRIQPSTARPNLISIAPAGGAINDVVAPVFEITFEATTFYPEDSRIVGRYSQSLNYQLIPNQNSAIDEGRMRVEVPRLLLSRDVEITLENIYGRSQAITVTLPVQTSEGRQFEPVNVSDILPPANHNDTFSRRHDSGVFGASGTDTVAITPLFQPGQPECNQRDFVITNVTGSWLNDDDQPTAEFGSLRVTGPRLNLRIGINNNQISTRWRLNPFAGRKFYQLLYRGVEVVLRCPDRVIN